MSGTKDDALTVNPATGEAHMRLAGLDALVVDPAIAATAFATICRPDDPAYRAEHPGGRTGPCADCGIVLMFGPTVPDGPPKVCHACGQIRITQMEATGAAVTPVTTLG